MGKKFKDLTDKKIGRWTVIKNLGTSLTSSGTRLYLCKCQCGKKQKVTANNLLSGLTKGCKSCHYKYDISSAFKDNRTKYPLYSIYHGMKTRCKSNKFTNRGIKICQRWLNPKTGFWNFVNDLGERPSSKHLLTRINYNVDYSPENCRWATLEQFYSGLLTSSNLARKTGYSRERIRQLKESILKPYIISWRPKVLYKPEAIKVMKKRAKVYKII